MEPEGSSPRSQEPATSLHAEPVESNPQSIPRFPKEIKFEICPIITGLEVS
jgi:hypothetical protein